MSSTNDDVVTVIRSEERLSASTTSVPVRRAILRKVVVSEERTVIVRHEEFRLDYEPIAPGSVPDAASAVLPLDLVLHEERLTVALVPVERVHVDVRAVVEQRAVVDDVRAERIDLDGVLLPAPDVEPTARHRA